MSHVNNIFNFKVNSVEGNGSVNFGNTIHKGNNYNDKQIGGQEITGDGSPGWMFDKNDVFDPDLFDQKIRRR